MVWMQIGCAVCCNESMKLRWCSCNSRCNSTQDDLYLLHRQFNLIVKSNPTVNSCFKNPIVLSFTNVSFLIQFSQDYSTLLIRLCVGKNTTVWIETPLLLNLQYKYLMRSSQLHGLLNDLPVSNVAAWTLQWFKGVLFYFDADLATTYVRNSYKVDHDSVVSLLQPFISSSSHGFMGFNGQK